MTLHLCCNLQIVSVLVWMPLKATEPVTCSRHAKNGTLKNITMWSCQASEQTRMSIPHTFAFSPMFLGCVGALLLSTFAFGVSTFSSFSVQHSPTKSKVSKRPELDSQSHGIQLHARHSERCFEYGWILWKLWIHPSNSSILENLGKSWNTLENLGISKKLWNKLSLRWGGRLKVFFREAMSSLRVLSSLAMVGWSSPKS